jgi:hypothetical protein
MAIMLVPRAMAGSNMKRKALISSSALNLVINVQNPLIIEASRPNMGNQLTCKATYERRTRPNQNPGMDTPINETTMVTKSHIVPRLVEAKRPNGIPNKIAMITETTANSMVAPNLSKINVLTGIVCLIDTPKSPRIALLNQRKYCTGRGWSKPYTA